MNRGSRATADLNHVSRPVESTIMGDDDRIKIHVSDDRLEARVGIAAGAPCPPDAMEAALERAGITEGLVATGIRRAASRLELESAATEEIVVARGRAPEPARPQRLDLTLPAGPTPGRVDEYDRMDFRMRDLIVPVERDEILGIVHPAKPGKPGVDVFGEPIEPELPADPDFSFGDGIDVAEDGTIRAGRVGARTVDAQRAIDVVECFEHPGHVDLTSGHLNSRGSLAIARDVGFEMRAEATHDLSIGGTVDGGQAIAGGSIEIRGGAIGRGVGRVKAGGDVRVRHALGIRIHSGGTLHVQRSVSASRLRGEVVWVDGRMLSNEISAERRIVVKEAGSPAGGPCRLRAAQPLEASLPLARPSGTGRRKRGATGTRDRHKRARTGRRGSGALERERRAELEARIALRARERALQQEAVIEIEGLAHSGCRIDFGGYPLVLDEDVRGQRFRFDPDTDRVVMEALS